ncbi:Hypothetical predicted protein [Mytilus galloprovincialis]|uniref:Endonuclease/exonuclease/phosphatase domain-containing protein n=1 Tax=Mytilus galloprovincialis TaxID=29158 RepID=A0A8B6C4P1_MYTGA|nr:Hypothetical predicted protein [Mytilus galloprovincialis]
MGDILLVGDLNARTGSEKDYIDGDSTSHVPLFDENYDVDCFTEERVSKDLITDSRGKNLLEFCIGNQLRILNGRMCGDSTDKKNVNDATYSIHSIYEKVCKVSLKKKKKRVKTCNHKKWFDQDLKSLKKHVNDKAILMSKFPKDPIVRGSFFKLNKQFAKLRRKKKREFRENIFGPFKQSRIRKSKGLLEPCQSTPS